MKKIAAREYVNLGSGRESTGRVEVLVSDNEEEIADFGEYYWESCDYTCWWEVTNPVEVPDQVRRRYSQSPY